MSQATGSLARRFQPHSAYKDSTVEWLGEIPAHWDVKKVKRLCPVRRGASPRPIDDPIYFDDEGEYAWVRIADVTASERYLEYTTQRLSTLGKSKSVALEPGELFVSIAATVGKPVITKIKCCIHDGFVYFVGLHENREFLFYLFSCGEPYKGLGKLGTQLNLNTDTIGDIYLPRPSGAEQVAIVQFLDRETAKIDALVAKKERLIELLEEKRVALITQAVTRGLKPNVPMKESGVEWLGQIPEHWDIKRLKYRAAINPEALPETSNPDYEFRYLDIANVDSRGSVQDLETLSFASAPSRARRIVRRGDTIISTVRTYLKAVAHFDFESRDIIVSTGFAVLRPNAALHDRFLWRLIQSDSFVQAVVSHSEGVGYPAIAPTALRDLPIWLPSENEQHAIAALLDCETAKIDALILKVRSAIEKLLEYRTALISAAVTGKIDVRAESNASGF